MKFVLAFHLACISVMLMFQIVSTQPHSPKRQEDCVAADVGGWSLCEPPLYVKGFWRNDPQQDSYPSSLRCDAAITSYDSCRCEEDWYIDLTTDGNISCPNAFFVSGLYFPSTGNLYFTQIYCCRPLNQPERNEECYVEDVFSTSSNGEGMSECQREGYFITGFYEKSYDFTPRIEKFKCCKMAAPED